MPLELHAATWPGTRHRTQRTNHLCVQKQHSTQHEQMLIVLRNTCTGGAPPNRTVLTPPGTTGSHEGASTTNRETKHTGLARHR